MSRIGSFGRRGASALEFALLVVVLVPLIVLTIEFSWYFAVRIAVDNCVRDAVRAGADVCDPDNCLRADGGECQFCLSPDDTDPRVVASARFGECWADTGYPGTPSATAVFANGASTGDRKLTVTGGVTYTSIAALTVLPTPVEATVTFRLDDQSF